MVAHAADVPIEFREGAALEKALIGRQVWWRDQGRAHDCCMAVENDKLRRAARHSGLVQEQGVCGC